MSHNVTQTDRSRTVLRSRHIGGRKSSEKIFHQGWQNPLEDSIAGREADPLEKN